MVVLVLKQYLFFLRFDIRKDLSVKNGIPVGMCLEISNKKSKSILVITQHC